MKRMLGTIANRLLAPFGLQLIRKSARSHTSESALWSPLEGALHGALSARGELRVVQVGANDGKWNDPIHRFLMRSRTSTRVLLIEPQPEIASILEETYRGHGSTTVFQGVIATESGTLVLYRVRPSLWDATMMPYLESAPRYRAPSGFASTLRSHVESHIAHLRWRETGATVPIDEALEELHVRALSMSDLASGYPDFFPLDVLQVDVEGIDDELVLSALDAGQFPLIINLEVSHLDDERRRRLESRLRGHGYDFTFSGADLLAVRTLPD